MKNVRRISWLVLTLVLALGITGAAQAASVTPIHVGGANNDGKDCSDIIPGSVELRVPGPAVGGTFSNGTLTVNITQPSSLSPTITASFDWTSNISVLAVIAKDGVDGAFVYNYSPTGSTGDIGLSTPGPAPYGTYKNISHINFCYVPPTAVDLIVEKTAVASYTRTFDWTIDKSANPTTVYSAGGGESAPTTFTVAVTKDGGTDSGWAVSGKITVHNPNSFAVNGVSLSDSTPGGTCTVTPASVDVAANSDTTADYVCTFGVNPGSGTNTATATWPNIGSPHTSGTGTADYTFGAPTTKVNDAIDVTDSNGKSWQFTDTGSQTYQTTYTDPAGTCTPHTNTARITTAGASANPSASVTVKDCQGADLTVEKTATPSYDLTYEWTIEKAVVGSDSATVDQGQPATFNYNIAVSHNAGTQSNWQVAGTITVANPNDWQDIVADVSDSLPGGSCSVTGGTQVTVSAGQSVTLNYSCTFNSDPGSGTKTNTATATWDADAAHTPNGAASGTANFDFATATVNAIDECVTVVDDKATPGDTSDDVTLGTACVGDPNPKTFSYSLTFTGPAAGACADFINTATFTTNDSSSTGSDNATVRVCSFKAALTVGYWGNHLAQTGAADCKSLPKGTGCSNNGPWAVTYLERIICTDCVVGKLGDYSVGTDIVKAAKVFAANNCSNAASSDANAAGCLAAQLLAAQLNVANGANPCICPIIKDAVAFLTAVGYQGPGSALSIGFGGTNTRAYAIQLKTALDNYNNGIRSMCNSGAGGFGGEALDKRVFLPTARNQ
ncbi:MAG: hypothetical protein DYG89_48570 [Caldilinea sp. CFX5]|nr:hypothetical protein [Caldilinea sp. CFX5]